MGLAGQTNTCHDSCNKTEPVKYMPAPPESIHNIVEGLAHETSHV